MRANSQVPQASPNSTERAPLLPRELAENCFLHVVFGDCLQVRSNQCRPAAIPQWGPGAEGQTYCSGPERAKCSALQGSWKMHREPPSSGQACEGSLKQGLTACRACSEHFPNTTPTSIHSVPLWPQPPDLPGNSRTRAVHPDVPPAFPPSTDFLCSCPQGLGDSSWYSRSSTRTPGLRSCRHVLLKAL